MLTTLNAYFAVAHFLMTDVESSRPNVTMKKTVVTVTALETQKMLI
jgi:hypothetical protein